MQEGPLRSGKCEAGTDRSSGLVVRPVACRGAATRSCDRPRPAWFLDHPAGDGSQRISLAAMARVALLGGGKMGAALVGGLLDGGYDPDDVCVAEVDPERRRDLEARFPKVRVVPSGAWAVADADVVIVAVEARRRARPRSTAALPALPHDALVLSIAAGVTIATVEAAAPGRPVVRAMPNTPALVGLGASAIAPGATATEEHLELAERLLACGRHRGARRGARSSTPSPACPDRVRRT